MSSLGNKTVSLSGLASGEEQIGEPMSYENSFIKIDEKNNGGNKMNDDLISRQAAIDIIKNHSYPVRYDGNSIEQGMTLTGIEQALKEVPSIQLEQKTGRWIETDDYDAWRCSECDEYFCLYEGTPQDNEYYYCPNCGAKMRMENG